MPLEVPSVRELLPTVLQGAGQRHEGAGRGQGRGEGRGRGGLLWPHLALVDDRAIGLGLRAVTVGTRAQAPGLCAQLLAGVCAGRLLALLGGLSFLQLRPLFLDHSRHRVLLFWLFSFPGWLHLHFCQEKGRN